ncbi:hypothetical protein ENUP19_0173G0025 [Entamoeba nuttalli]|uniref:Threonylcarbamoyl-AMP synthase C-terminal domain-containing protein n=1 Tax=Entamoeba nuttalli TaxID=412467 RepID=A0ABQ0DMN4_9EUKA
MKVTGDKYKGMAHALFTDMRDLDGKVDIILIEGVQEIKEGVSSNEQSKESSCKSD